uniref:Light-independent protochlorophyllide reductase subunit B n=1 Tax=Porolithon onkodes TaxID=231751 RepID=A0A2Z2L5X5_9FLOR|nr:photochlorophyllide reductase subunit B [Porolithon onkodes]ASB29730.1 photochlorophyllide reductase subunit B [Porolithon onkodes]
MKLAYWMYAGPAHIGTLRIASSFKNVHAIMHAPLGDDYFVMIVRHNNLLLYQDIKWRHLAKYIDKLKSREYKAFIQKYHIYNIQNYFVNFPLLVLSSSQSSLCDINSQINSFELGYILYCFTSIRCVDISFFYYYRNIFNIKIFTFIKYLVFQAHYLLIFLSCQIYGSYIRYLCKTFYGSHYNFDNSFYKQYIELQKYERFLVLDLRYLVDYLSLSRFFNKMYNDKCLVKYILNILDIKTFDRLLISLHVGTNKISIYQSKLLRKLQEVVMLQLIYELSSLLYRSYKLQNIKLQIVVFDKNNEIIFFYNKALERRLNYFLLCGGVFKNIKEELIRGSLLNGIFTRSSFYSIESFSYPFNFIFKPSLYNQFILMKYVSLIIHKLDIQSSFVINIRLNMLLVVWLSQYKRLSKRVLYLLDYLIDLKLRYYLMYSSHFLIKLSQKSYLDQTILRRKNYFCTSLYNKKYRKYYSPIKLLWDKYFKCYINLREAV